MVGVDEAENEEEVEANQDDDQVEEIKDDDAKDERIKEVQVQHPHQDSNASRQTTEGEKCDEEGAQGVAGVFRHAAFHDGSGSSIYPVSN